MTVYNGTHRETTDLQFGLEYFIEISIIVKYRGDIFADDFFSWTTRNIRINSEDSLLPLVISLVWIFLGHALRLFPPGCVAS